MSVKKYDRAILAVLSVAVLLGAGCSDDNNGSSEPTAVPAIATATGNTNTAPVQAVASNANNPNASGSAILPQNVTLTTADGETVSGENVVVTIEAYDGEEASEKAFVGGTTFNNKTISQSMADALNTTVDTDQPVTLDLAGYANVNVSANGKSIKSFNPPVTIVIKTQLPAGTTVAVISVDENTAERRFEGTAQVRSDGNVVINTDHLTAIAVVGSIRNTTGTGTGGQGSTR